MDTWKQKSRTAPPQDDTGFWVIKHSYPGAGGSLITIAIHTCTNGEVVSQKFFSPSSFDFESAAKSTYSVHLGIFGLPDEVSEAATKRLIREIHPTIDAQGLSAAEIEIWSPDGEGALFLKFGDLDVEHALRLAQSLRPGLQFRVESDGSMTDHRESPVDEAPWERAETAQGSLIQPERPR